MEMEINNLYNSYATSYMNAANRKKQTDISNQEETGAQSRTSAEKTANNDAGSMKANGSRKYLKTLQKKMTHVQLETGFGLNTKKDNKVGTITLNPKILEKMQNDPEAEKKYTQMIKDIEKAEKTVGAYYNALGGVVEHSSHWYIDENGHYCHFGYVRRDDKLNQKLREEAQKNAEKQIEKIRENAGEKAEQLAKKLEEKAEKAKDGNVSDYYSYLRKNYDCLSKGNVTISGDYLEKCAGNSAKAKELEDFLKKIPELEKQGYEELAARNKALGGTVTHYQQTWMINKDGSIQSTVYSVTETGMTNVERMKKSMDERLEKQKEKKEEEEKIKEQKEKLKDAVYQKFDVGV